MKRITVTRHGWGVVVEQSLRDRYGHDPNARFITAQTSETGHEQIEVICSGKVLLTLAHVPLALVPDTIIELMRRYMK